MTTDDKWYGMPMEKEVTAGSDTVCQDGPDRVLLCATCKTAQVMGRDGWYCLRCQWQIFR